MNEPLMDDTDSALAPVLTATELVDGRSLAYLNEAFLAGRGFRVETSGEFDPYSRYTVYQGETEVFTTVYPKELLIKVAQLLPDSEVRVAHPRPDPHGEDRPGETLEIVLQDRDAGDA